MKIPVYDAGVPVCNPEKNLFCAGKDVTLLAWEQWRRKSKQTVFE